MNIPKIKGFLPVSMLDWPGQVSSVVFLGGCSFRCPACHNHGLVLSPENISDYPLDRIMGFLRERSGWIDGVTVTGGEPTCHDGTPALISKFKELGLKVKLDTNGSNPTMLKKLINDSLIDAVSMDIKAPLEPGLYSRLAGVPVNLSNIEKSVKILKKSHLNVFFRTTVIPGLIGESELDAIRTQLGDVTRYSIQRFRNSDTLDPEFRQIPDLDLASFDALKLKFEKRRLEECGVCLN
ncbi:MAG: anaerobic ribonucleoside-triphosphate reductase activating protein [Deltaproteobacteria bacterium]|nr:anaerobic ribonucleoside-triphosphate reductase activating protein [Deltaproteobacteria bacterium]